MALAVTIFCCKLPCVSRAGCNQKANKIMVALSVTFLGAPRPQGNSAWEVEIAWRAAFLQAHTWNSRGERGGRREESFHEIMSCSSSHLVFLQSSPNVLSQVKAIHYQADTEGWEVVSVRPHLLLADATRGRKETQKQETQAKGPSSSVWCGISPWKISTVFNIGSGGGFY